jgi:CheY-like chemotaxis protein
MARQYRYVTSRILIVDDSPPFRAAAAELLIERGFEVLVTAGIQDQGFALPAGSRDTSRLNVYSPVR